MTRTMTEHAYYVKCIIALFCKNRTEVGHGPSRAIYAVVARRLVKKRE
jgi:hypothetical protein